jgi:RimJ/RimL family protein N-acetyltransferase
MTSYESVWIETERLAIRAWRPDEDAEGAFAMYGDPEVVEHLTGEVVESLEAQRAWLEQIVAAYSRLGLACGPFAVLHEGGVVGCALLKPLPRTDELDAWAAFRDGGPPPAVREVEVGWHLARAHWGKGFATEAARAMVRHGFATLGLSELHAVLYRENTRSARVAERIGMLRTGPTDKYYGRTLEHYLLQRPEPRH